MLQEIANFVHGNLAASASMVGLALEMILRLFPSQKPMGLLIAASAVVHSVADIISGISAFLDKVIPQNTK